MIKHYQWLVMSAIMAMGIQPAYANCADSIGRLDYFQPAMERNWAMLQAQTSFPWGQTQVFHALSQNTIQLKAEFNQLTGPQKQQVLQALKLGKLYQELTPEEQARPGIGALEPYQVIDSRGRLVYTPYDGCTQVILMTERDRYSYYYNRRPTKGDRTATINGLRNTEQPFWRDTQASIRSSQETDIRLKFWETVGYDKANQGWWIAWVPEEGGFEINVTQKTDLAMLNSFWAIAPTIYPYQVLLKDGTPIHKRDAL